MKNNKFITNLYKIIMILVDIGIILFSVYISYMLKFNLNPPKFNYDPFVEAVPFTIIVYIIFMYVYGLVDILKKSISEIIYSLFLTILMLFISTMAIAFFIRGFSYPRTVIILSSIFQFLFLSLWRTAVWKVNRKIHGKKPVLIIGNMTTDDIAKKVILKQKDLYFVKYICDSYSDKIEDYIKNVELVIICDDVDSNFKSQILDICLREQKNLYIIPTMNEIALANSKLTQVDDVPLLAVNILGLTIEQKFIKRLCDLIVSIIGIIITSPIMLVVAAIIKFTDGGKIFYKQERVTEGEKLFNVIKFRSMVVNAEKMTGPVLASENDPRITKIGRIIRATRIDELPQLFNILKGDMSIVGPRPERPFYVEKYKKDIPDYKYRTVVKAGLTGLAQVLGKYNTKPEDKLRYDIIYIKNYSILNDLKLIFQTIKIIFMKESTEGIHNEEISLDSIIGKMGIDVKIDKK